MIFDYFVAASDAVAAETIDLAGGPGEAGLRTLSVKGIDPVVQLGTLTSLLTSIDYEIVADSVVPANVHPSRSRRAQRCCR